MAQRCVSCGAENPVTNRYCGQCGMQLERADTANLADDAAAGAINDAVGSQAVDDTPANSDATDPLGKYRIVVENADTARTGFLGLSDNDAPAYNDEEPVPPSHLRRNIAISVVVVAVALTAALTVLQWHSIRDRDVLRHWASALGNSTEAVPPNPSAGAPNGVGRTSELPSAEANAGAYPATKSSPSTDLTHPVQRAGKSLESAPPTAGSSRSAGTGSPRAMSAPAADIPENRSPAVFNPPAKPRAAQPAGSLPGVGAGAYEMSRAAHANDGDARAAWLWKAIAKGNSQASVELARMYVQGIGVPRNCDQAQILLRGAAEKGNEQARLSLQRILRQGGCTPR